MKIEEIIPAIKKAGITFTYAYGRETIRSLEHTTKGGSPLSPIACLVKLKLQEKGEDVSLLDNFCFEAIEKVLEISGVEMRQWFCVEDVGEAMSSMKLIDPVLHKKLRAELEKLTKGTKPTNQKRKSPKSSDSAKESTDD